MDFWLSINIGKFIIPTDELIFFRRVGWNHQPEKHLLMLLKVEFFCFTILVDCWSGECMEGWTPQTDSVDEKIYFKSAGIQYYIQHSIQYSILYYKSAEKKYSKSAEIHILYFWSISEFFCVLYCQMHLWWSQMVSSWGLGYRPVETDRNCHGAGPWTLIYIYIYTSYIYIYILYIYMYNIYIYIYLYIYIHAHS